MTKENNIEPGSAIGNEIADAYRWLCKLEGQYGEYPRNVALQIVNRCKSVANLVDDGDSHKDGLLKEIKELEDYMASRGTFNAATTNLGVRIAIHLICRDNNLFGSQTGWFSHKFEGNEKELQHYLDGNITVCGHEFHPKEEPRPGIFDYLEFSPLCQVCAKAFIDKHAPPKLDKPENYTKMFAGFEARYENGKRMEVWVEHHDHEQDPDNPKKIKEFRVKCDIYGNVLERKETREY